MLFFFHVKDQPKTNTDKHNIVTQNVTAQCHTIAVFPFLTVSSVYILFVIATAIVLKNNFLNCRNVVFSKHTASPQSAHTSEIEITFNSGWLAVANFVHQLYHTEFDKISQF